MDVKSVFINGRWEEYIYVSIEGYINPNKKNLVYKIRKTIYCLKESSCEWYKRINDYLRSCGFKNSGLEVGGIISWKSKRQNNITLSNTKAKYISNFQSIKEAIWLQNLLKDLGEDQTNPTILNCDN